MQYTDASFVDYFTKLAKPLIGIETEYQRLNAPVNFYDIGVNWLLAGHTSKLTLAYQSRPVYTTDAGGAARATDRKGSTILQYQVFFN